MPFRRPAINFRWRLLVPTLGGMWIVVALLALYQYNRESTIRNRSLVTHLEMMTANVLEAYGSGVDIPSFVDFIGQYYSNSNYAGVRLSVYNYDGSLVHSAGEPIPFGFSDYSFMTEETATPEMKALMSKDPYAVDDRLFCFMTQKSIDGKICVMTAMPLTVPISGLLGRANTMWFFILPILALASLFIILHVNHVSRSVRALAEFADYAARGVQPQGDYDFGDDELGQVSRQIVSIYRDKVHALEANEREHSIAMNAIVEKTRFKREMSNNISHELKTPIGIIKGYIDTILSSPDMDAETMRRFLERAQSNTDRLTAMLNDLSTITRLDDGVNQITLTSVNFHDLVFTIDDEMRLSGVLKGFKFSYDIPLTTVVKGNISLLQGAVYNLIRNAVRHSGGTLMRLDQTGESERYYSFRFYDDGRGVPESDIPRLFERFFRVDAGRSSKTGGTGLGLTIVHNTITALGGAISVKNRSTGGLEFTFTLPKWSPDA